MVGKPEGKRQLRRHRRRWMDKVRMDLQEVDMGMWTGLGWTRIETCVAGSYECGTEHSGSLK